MKKLTKKDQALMRRMAASMISQDLEDEVLTVMEGRASAINNQGTLAQVKLMVEEYGMEWVQKWLVKNPPRPRKPLDVIEEEYEFDKDYIGDAMVQGSITMEASGRRLGSEHQEVRIRGKWRCAVCGNIERKNNPDPAWHPEAYFPD